jgi:hypothetical protein
MYVCVLHTHTYLCVCMCVYYTHAHTYIPGDKRQDNKKQTASKSQEKKSSAPPWHTYIHAYIIHIYTYIHTYIHTYQETEGKITKDKSSFKIPGEEYSAPPGSIVDIQDDVSGSGKEAGSGDTVMMKCV